MEKQGRDLTFILYPFFNHSKTNLVSSTFFYSILSRKSPEFENNILLRHAKIKLNLLSEVHQQCLHPTVYDDLAPGMI